MVYLALFGCDSAIHSGVHTAIADMSGLYDDTDASDLDGLTPAWAVTLNLDSRRGGLYKVCLDPDGATVTQAFRDIGLTVHVQSQLLAVNPAIVYKQPAPSLVGQEVSRTITVFPPDCCGGLRAYLTTTTCDAATSWTHDAALGADTAALTIPA